MRTLLSLDAPIQRRQRAPGPVLKGWEHGRIGTYRHGCRCDECRDAETIRSRLNRLRAAGLVEPYVRRSPGRTHGTISCYNAGCRCEDCRAACREHRRRFRARHRTRDPHANQTCSLCGDSFVHVAKHDRFCEALA